MTCEKVWYECIDREIPEGDYRLIRFRNIDTREEVKRWFPLTHEHFQFAQCPQLFRRYTWKEIEEITTEA